VPQYADDLLPLLDEGDDLHPRPALGTLQGVDFVHRQDRPRMGPAQCFPFFSIPGQMRFVYFIKAMYSGRFTWMPTIAQGLYHPQYFGRTAIQAIEVRE
jgi:hypothetical protein